MLTGCVSMIASSRPRCPVGEVITRVGKMRRGVEKGC